jgi:hypothetical protein
MASVWSVGGAAPSNESAKNAPGLGIGRVAIVDTTHRVGVGARAFRMRDMLDVAVELAQRGDHLALERCVAGELGGFRDRHRTGGDLVLGRRRPDRMI